MTLPAGRAAAGRDAEERAAAYLASRGMAVLERNFRTKAGEIDLVARDGEEVVFVEVRSRAGAGFGGAAASVDRAKRARIARAARRWLAARRWEGPCRFDVVALEAGRLEHIPAAFEAGS
ncbi:MAG: YraN family protein [Elusimicrobia bacterium]|nr:YraN family protein [Elusimicrobiota bacterium]